ncbi:MAG: GNAT family N-acetyltransferase [Myxococcota bacterium]
MSERWAYARQQWMTAFAPLKARGFRLERLDQKTYFDRHERELRAVFPPEVFFDPRGWLPERRIAQLERLSETRADQKLEDFVAVYRGDKLAAMFCGHQHVDDAYRMWHANVSPDFRRQGLYRQIVRSTIDYTDKLGFRTITSEHAPGNNAVLIAKLSCGFRITSMAIEPSVGLSVVLMYFHSSDELALYEHRTGLATLNNNITKTAFGAYAQLKSQIQDS